MIKIQLKTLLLEQINKLINKYIKLICINHIFIIILNVHYF